MNLASIVLTPPIATSGSPAPEADWADAVTELIVAGGARVISPHVPRDTLPDAGTDVARRAHWVAHCAVGIAAASPPGAVVIVAHGESGPHVPALGFSQRAARRALAGYVLIDADVPPVGAGQGDWPDAPVTYIATAAADPARVAQARLRGWPVVEAATPTLIATTILGLAVL